MIRALGEPLVVFLIPFAIYVAWLAVRLVNPFAIDRWTRRVVIPLAFCGLVLAVGALVVLGVTAPRVRGWLRAGASRKRPRRSGPDAMNDARQLLDDPALQRVLALLDRDGEEARVVGGAIRNALLGRPTTDMDITTTARPETVTQRAAAAGVRTVPTGIAHGTVTLIVEGRPFEVTTLREDVDTDGRHAVVRFGRDFAADAIRRDFTINALSMGPDGVVHDYAGGLADLAAGRVRFIGDPDTRIAEDYLRILRFFRFSADYAEGELDPDGLAAAIRGRAGLARLSRERIRQEVLKLLGARRATAATTAMADAGLLGPLLQSLPQPHRLGRLVAIAPGADVVLRLAAVSAVVPDDAVRLREALRLSTAEALRLERATMARCRLHPAASAPDQQRLLELLFDLGRPGARDGLMLAWVDSAAVPDDAGWGAALRILEEMPEPRLPFAGAALIARGIPPGRAMGETRNRLKRAWIDAGFPEDPDHLAALLDAAVPPAQDQ